MYNKTKRQFAAVLVIAMVVGMVATLPMTAKAWTASDVALIINKYDPKNGGATTGQLRATISGNTITVTGTVVGATNYLGIELDSGVKVIWKASFSTNTTDPIFHVYGQGELEIPAGGSIESIGPNAILARNENSVMVTGGTVSAMADDPPGAYNSTIVAGSVTVTSGRVEKTGSTGAIRSNNIDIAGGIVISDGVAIWGDGEYTRILIRGGNVVSHSGYAIYVDEKNADISVSGGVVSGSIVSNYTNSSLRILDGLVESPSVHYTISIPNFRMRGGIVRNTGEGHAISNTHRLEIDGGTISAKSGYAIVTGQPNAQVRIYGGFIFSYGTHAYVVGAHTGSATIYLFNGAGPANITGEAVICAWDNSSGNDEYVVGTTTDLTVYPEGATVEWGSEERVMIWSPLVTSLPFGGVSPTASLSRLPTLAYPGIRYSHNANEGFFDVEGVKVVSAAVVPPDVPPDDLPEEVAKYTVTFNSNGGSAVSAQTVTSGDKATKPADPSRADHTFAGWFSNNALTTAYNFDTAVMANLTLYAKWEASTSSEASPEETSSMESFLQSRIYTSEMFRDINEDAWYGYNKERAVANTYEFGLMSGYPDNTIRPTGNITIAEAITIAARVHSIYTTGADDFNQGNPWYQVYIDYAVSNGIISATDFTVYNQLATRREMAYIFANALPESELEKQNTVNSLPDVSASTPYASSIIMLYEAGVIGGSDNAGTFNPGNFITRAEAAAIISRVILPGERFGGRTYG